MGDVAIAEKDVSLRDALRRVPKAYKVGAKKFVEFLEKGDYSMDWSGFEAYIEELEERYQATLKACTIGGTLAVPPEVETTITTKNG